MSLTNEQIDALPLPEPITLPTGCGYQGYEFGARYPDSECFGGRLYDMDNCNDNGFIYEPCDYKSCPMCRRKDAIAEYKEENLFSVCKRKKNGGLRSTSKRDCARAARSLVRSIRMNRKRGTEPWKS